ncbi:MAG: hypothetical protein AAF517_20525, partial [Planctomycetota bacterium]
MLSRTSQLAAFALTVLLAGDLLAQDESSNDKSSKDEKPSVESVIARLRKAPQKKRAAVIDELIDLGPEARKATVAARDGAEGALKKAFARAARWQLAETLSAELRAGLETQLTFDGQYTKLKELGADGVDALLAILDDSA